MKNKMKYAFIVLLATDISVLMAAPTTQPAPMPVKPTAPATTQPDNAQARDYRNSRESGRSSRRNRDRGNANNSVTAAPAGDPFAVLDTRSIFVKGDQTISANANHTTNFQPVGGLARKPEAALVFNGVTLIDGQANAFIEDLTADRVSTVKVGDAIAGGKVSAITFDTLTYQGNGRTLNVTLGQNLEGNLAISTAMDSTAGAAATTSPTTLPFQPGYIGVGGSSGVITNGMSPEDILARMKAKRQAEMNPK